MINIARPALEVAGRTVPGHRKGDSTGVFKGL